MAESMVEEVVFRTTGLDELTAEHRGFIEQLEKARRAQEAMQNALRDPAQIRAVADLQTLTRANRDYTTAQLTALRVEERRRSLSDGTAVIAARERLRLAREEAVLMAGERRAELAARYGQTGGRLVGVAESRAARLATGAVAAGTATATGLAAKGFSGTVEMERFNLQLTLVSRQFASVMKPALDLTTRGLDSLNRVMSRLNGTQQDALMYSTLAAGGTLAASQFSKRVFGVGLVEGGAALAARTGLSAGGQAAATAGGTAVGAGTGAAAGAATRTGVGATVAAYAAPVAAAAAVLYSGWKGLQSLENVPGNYAAARKNGRSVAGAAAFTFGAFAVESQVRTLSDFGLGDLLGLTGDAKKRRDVTPADVGYGAIGSGFDEVTVKASMLGVGESDRGPFEEAMKLLNVIAENTAPKESREAPPRPGRR